MLQQSHSDSIGQSREWVRQWRQLGQVVAPATILPAVLEQVGLIDAYAPMDTPLGPMFVAFNRHGISAVLRATSELEVERIFQQRFGRPLRRVASLPTPLRGMVQRHLRGAKPSSLRFDLRHLSDFERAVLLKARQIPLGEVRPYAWVAREIGSPGAVRAVGSALGRNPVPLLIPCHRVVRSDGSIGEYALGREAKQTILAAEGVDAETLTALAHSGVRYYGSDTTRIYCFLTCRHARRVSARHRVTFDSVTTAVAAGYRPCRICRPALTVSECSASQGSCSAAVVRYHSDRDQPTPSHGPA